MFAIHSPQTITLHTDDGHEDEPATVTFSVDTDSSKCRMTVASKGRTWTAVFNTRGMVIDQVYAPPVKDGKPAPVLTHADYIVDGHDIRSDNPYTHVAPVTADTAYPPAATAADIGTPAYVPPVRTPEQIKADKETADLARKAHDEAEKNAQKLRDERAKLAAEKPEERAAREKKERDEKLKLAAQAAKPGTPTDYRGPDTTRPPATPPGVVNTTQTMSPRATQPGEPDHNPFA